MTAPHELIEARDEKRLLRLQKQLASHELLIIDELGFVPLSKTGAELLFVLISQRCERVATIITSNLPFDEWTGTFGEERLTGAHETQRYDQFNYGVSDRGASVRIPWQVHLDQKGYIEDRRPNANMDPYVVTRLITNTCCEALAG